MKGLVTIFAMPQEIDDLHVTLYNLKRNVSMLPDGVEMDIDLTFCMSDELTDWENTKLPKQYFIDKFNSILPLIDWSKNKNVRIETENTILGCVSQRRMSLDRMKREAYDFVIWLDTDVFFKDTTLWYMTAAYESAKQTNNPYYVITPQFVKQWDNTWDAIVNPQYLNHKIDYELEADIFIDTLKEYGEISVKPISSFKFAGGWFTLVSKELLELVGIPESFGHYGLEDTFLTSACDLLRKFNHRITPQQYVLENHLVGETYVHRCNTHLKSYVSSKNRKEEFRDVAVRNFNNELHEFRRRVIGI